MFVELNGANANRINVEYLMTGLLRQYTRMQGFAYHFAADARGRNIDAKLCSKNESHRLINKSQAHKPRFALLEW